MSDDGPMLGYCTVCNANTDESGAIFHVVCNNCDGAGRGWMQRALTAEAALAEYRKAVAEQFHYDMNSVLSNQAERRTRIAELERERDEARAERDAARNEMERYKCEDHGARIAGGELLDALVLKGHDTPSAWENACLRFGRYMAPWLEAVPPTTADRDRLAGEVERATKATSWLLEVYDAAAEQSQAVEECSQEDLDKFNGDHGVHLNRWIRATSHTEDRADVYRDRRAAVDTWRRNTGEKKT